LFNSEETSSTETASNLVDIQTAAKAVNGLTVSLVDDAGIKGFKSGKAVKMENQGAVHVTKYLKGLAGVVKSLGGEIYEGSRYINHKMVEKKLLVDLEEDIKVVAEDLVFATQIPPQKVSISFSILQSNRRDARTARWYRFTEDANEGYISPSLHSGFCDHIPTLY
jgi:hypothetical protein